jgi:hypothetical protein
VIGSGQQVHRSKDACQNELAKQPSLSSRQWEPKISCRFDRLGPTSGALVSRVRVGGHQTLPLASKSSALCQYEVAHRNTLFWVREIVACATSESRGLDFLPKARCPVSFCLKVDDQ